MLERDEDAEAGFLQFSRQFTSHAVYLIMSFFSLLNTHAQWLEEKANAPDLMCLVIFRGTWCKYDKHYLRKLGNFFKPMIEKENITLIAWTSQGADGASKADKEWGLTKDLGFKQVLGDETNALAKHLVEDVILQDLITMTPEEAGVTELVKKAGASYPNGIVMPAIVWYAHHGSAPVFEWSHKCDGPGPCGGPLRPDPAGMWEQVLKRKHALDHGNAVMPSHGANIKMCSTETEVQLASCQVL